jgi:hypothetical protein
MCKNAVKSVTRFEIKLTWYQSLWSEELRAAARSRPKVDDEWRLPGPLFVIYKMCSWTLPLFVPRRLPASYHHFIQFVRHFGMWHQIRNDPFVCGLAPCVTYEIFRIKLPRRAPRSEFFVLNWWEPFILSPCDPVTCEIFHRSLGLWPVTIQIEGNWTVLYYFIQFGRGCYALQPRPNSGIQTDG